MFQSRNLDQNVHKNALFFEKIWKIAEAILKNRGWSLNGIGTDFFIRKCPEIS